MYSYVDSAHMAHHDLKGHTGGFICFRSGVFAVKSKKQRLNSNSSCEAELIGAGEYLKQIIWARNFMIAQGYEMKPTIIFQDNESTIKLIKYGRRSSSSKTRHIDNKYFDIHGKFIDGEIKTVSNQQEKCGLMGCRSHFKAINSCFLEIKFSMRI